MAYKLNNYFAAGTVHKQADFNVALWVVPMAFAYGLILAPILMFSASGGAELGSGINLAAAEGTASNKVIWLLLVGMVAYAWINTGDKVLITARLHVIVLFVYLLIVIGSAGWSDVPAISLRRSMQQAFLLIAMVAPFVLVADRQAILDKVCWIFAAVILINVLVLPILGVPDFGYRGIYSQKNSLGQIITTGFFFCVYAAIRREGIMRCLFIGLAFLAVGLCVVSRSKTSIGLMFVTPLLASCLIGLFTIKDSLARIFATVICVILVATVAAAAVLIPFGISDISELIFHDTTFTGRTKIWAFAGHYISQSPYIGYGFGSFWAVGEATRALGEGFIEGLVQAHNGYVDVVLEMGYVGLFIVTVLIITLLVNILRLAHFDGLTSLLLLTCLLFVLLNNTMESSLFRSYAPLWMVFLLCCGVTWQKPQANRLA